MIDPYVRSLAAAQTPCFGFYDSSHPVCANCPLSAPCAGFRTQRAAKLASEIAVSEQKTQRATPAARSTPAQAPLAPAVRKSVGDVINADAGESIDDILASIPAMPAKANTRPPLPVESSNSDDVNFDDLFGSVLDAEPAPASAPAPASGPRKVAMRAVVDSICSVCASRIHAKEEAWFVPGRGLFHKSCE